MFGRCSLSLPLNLCDLDLEHTLRRSKTERNSSVLRERSIETMVEEEERPVLQRDHYLPFTYTSPSCLQLPNVMVANYKIKSSIIQMLPSFYGLNNEDLYKHLDEFLKFCSTIKLHGFSEDALRMRLFPFSLKDKAKHWLKSSEVRSKHCHFLDSNAVRVLEEIYSHRKNQSNQESHHWFLPI
jgi:hypothetical protein